MARSDSALAAAARALRSARLRFLSAASASFLSWMICCRADWRRLPSVPLEDTCTLAAALALADAPLGGEEGMGPLAPSAISSSGGCGKGIWRGEL